MNKKRLFNIVKWISIVVVSIMLIMSGLILVFKENIKAYAVEEGNKYLNKRLHIGYMDVGIWNTFPSMSISFDDVLVFSRFDTLQTLDTAIYAEKMILKFNPFDFFKGEYNVKQIDVKKAKINLTILEDGRVNYDFLKPKEDESASSFHFDLERINLINADFSYKNELTDQFYAGFFNDLALNGSFTEKQFILDAETTFDIQSIQNKALTLIENQSAKCKVKIQMDQINNVFEIVSADLAVNNLPFVIRGKVSGDSLDFYIGAKNLSLVDVAKNFSLNELELVQKIKGTGLVNFELTIDGKTSKPAFEATFGVIDGSLSDKGFSVSDINLEGKYSNGVKGRKEELSISKLQFLTLNEVFDGRLSVSDFHEPRLVGHANGKIDLLVLHRLFGPFDMDELLGEIEINGKFDVRFLGEERSLQNLEINTFQSQLNLQNIQVKFKNDNRIIQVQNGNINIKNQYAKIEDLSLQLNNSQLEINGELNRIADYFNKKNNLDVNVAIKSEAIYVADLSSTEKQEEQEKVRDWLLPNDIAGSVTVDLGKVDYSNHTYSDISGRLTFGEHRLIFNNLNGVVSGAKVSGGLVIFEEKPMVLDVETTLTSNNIDLKPIMKEWNNFEQNVITEKNISGRAKVFLYFKGPFDLFEDGLDMNKIEVLARIGIQDGELKNVESFKGITKSLKESAAKLVLNKRRINSFEERLLNLKFDDFQNEFTVKEGVLTIPNMTIKSNALDLTLEGTHSFDNAINYGFNFRYRELKGNKQSEFGDVIDDETGFRIFLRMTGSIDNPNFAWDREAKRALKQEEREQAREDLKSVLKQGFNINKEDTTISDYTSPQKTEDEIIMDFGNESPKQEEPEKEKTGLGRKIDKWKEEKKEQEQPVFEWE